jgi:hypothetical protein
MEGWATVRVGGTTEWQRVWFVVSAMGASSGSIDAGRSGSPPGPGTGTMKRNRMSSIFGKAHSHNAAVQLSSPTVTICASDKIKDRRRPKYTLTNVTQAFAVYPERPEVIQTSTLFKIEGSMQDEEIKLNEHERRPAQDGYLLVMPETDPARPGCIEMLKWLVGQYHMVFWRFLVNQCPPDSHPRRFWVIWTTRRLRMGTKGPKVYVLYLSCWPISRRKLYSLHFFPLPHHSSP